MTTTNPATGRAPTSIDAHMRETDALLWTMERAPVLRATIMLVAVLDGSPSMPTLTERLERLTRVAPLFRQRVVESPFHLASPMFVVDADFDLDWHVHVVRAADPRTLESVLGEAAKAGATAFDPQRPLWECTVVDGIDGDRSAVLLKVHHTLTDGLGGMQLLSHLLDLDPATTQADPLPPGPPPPDPRSGSVAEALTYDCRQLIDATRTLSGSVARTLTDTTRTPLATTRDVIATARSILRFIGPPPQSRSPLMRERGLQRRYLLLDVPTDRLKAAAHAAGGTLNDAFIAAITSGLRIYHERHGTPISELSGTVPVSIRTSDDPIAGNRIATVRYVDDVTTTDPAERIRAVHARMRQSRDERAFVHMEALFGIVNRLPAAYLQGSTTNMDFTASNVPGIPVPVYCGGAPVTALYPFGPTIGASLNATLLSYNGTCNIGLNVDTHAVADQDTLLESLRMAFRDVLALAG